MSSNDVYIEQTAKSQTRLVGKEMNATPRTPLKKKRPMNNMRECVCMRACAENLIVRTSSTELEKDEDK